MAFNWHISVGNPVLQAGQYFVVRYRKLPSGSWIDFLPNPTTNLFTIPALQEGNYAAEIRVYCLDGTISPPRYITKSCGDVGTAPTVNIFWQDIGGTATRPCASGDTTYPITVNATDLENDIVLVEVQSSPDGITWTTIAIIPDGTTIFDASADVITMLYRFRVTDAQNNVSISNVLQIQCGGSSGSGSSSAGSSATSSSSDTGGTSSSGDSGGEPSEPSDGGSGGGSDYEWGSEP